MHCEFVLHPQGETEPHVHFCPVDLWQWHAGSGPPLFIQYRRPVDGIVGRVGMASHSGCWPLLHRIRDGIGSSNGPPRWWNSALQRQRIRQVIEFTKAVSVCSVQFFWLRIFLTACHHFLSALQFTYQLKLQLARHNTNRLVTAHPWWRLYYNLHDNPSN